MGPDLQVELLNSARGTDRPTLVSKVALELADHVGHGERGEFTDLIRIEPFDRLHERQTRDLVEIVVWLTPIGESAGQVVSETQMVLDDRVA